MSPASPAFARPREAGMIDPATIACLRRVEPRRIHRAASGRRRFASRTGLKLVAARGRYMQEAAVATPSGMVAIWARTKQRSRDSAESAPGRSAGAGQLQAPGQIVVSGSHRRVRAGPEGRRGGGLQGDRTEGRRGVSQPADADRRRPDEGRSWIACAFALPGVRVYSNVTAAAA